MITFELKDVGRRKWNGEATCQIDNPEHIEAAILRAVRPHLMSQDVEVIGDVDAGEIVVGGFRSVGTYKRKVTA